MNNIEIKIGDKLYFYSVYKRKKKNGGFRTITAPCPELKALQKKFADEFRDRGEPLYSKEITGFRPGMSIKDNANKHTNKEWVVNLDIKSFFPSTSLELISWAVRFLNMDNFDDIELDNWLNILSLDGGLPQGSPASPTITNLIGMYYVDPLVKEELNKLNIEYEYTRYADDITFSINSNGLIKRDVLRNTVDAIKRILTEKSPYRIAEDKIHVRHRSQRQFVTGIIVNQGFSITREERLRLRATLHKVKLGEKEIDPKLYGKLNFVKEIKPKLYEKLIGDNNGI